MLKAVSGPMSPLYLPGSIRMHAWLPIYGLKSLALQTEMTYSLVVLPMKKPKWREGESHV